MTDLMSWQHHIENLEEIVTAWQIPEPAPADDEENDPAVTTEPSTADRLVNLLGW